MSFIILFILHILVGESRREMWLQKWVLFSPVLNGNVTKPENQAKRVHYYEERFSQGSIITNFLIYIILGLHLKDWFIYFSL